MKKQLLFLAGIALLLIFHSGLPPALASSQVYKEISAPEVKSMLDTEKVVVINLMSKVEFEMQHIPGSINIPFNGFKTSSKLPKDKNQAIILHCMGEQ